MPTTPIHALPYPAGTDPVSDGAVNFQGLATAVDGKLVPKGGTPSGLAAAVLAKNTGTDYDAGWRAMLGLPGGGAAGQILTKNTSTDGDVRWAAVPHELPAAGAAGAILQKASAADYDVVWVPAAGGYVPAGGAAGQVLTKTSSADFATAWSTPTGGGGGGGTLVVGTAAELPVAPTGNDRAALLLISPEGPLPLGFDATLGKWVSLPFLALAQGGNTAGGGWNTSNSGFVEFDTVSATQISRALLPFRPFDAAGFKPQLRIRNTSRSTSGTLSLQASYQLLNTGAAIGAWVALPACVTNVTATVLTAADSGWVDIPAGYTAADDLLASFQGKSSGGTQSLTANTTVHLRWRSP